MRGAIKAVGAYTDSNIKGSQVWHQHVCTGSIFPTCDHEFQQDGTDHDTQQASDRHDVSDDEDI